jgi:hypothetical protein
MGLFMGKATVIRQYFVDLLENLGDNVEDYDIKDEEECNEILTDLFFSSKLELKWNPDKEKLMLKPEITCELLSKRGDQE